MEKTIKLISWTINETQKFTTPSCYPNSGMYLVSDGLTEHLVYVNQELEHVLMICPKETIPEEVYGSGQIETQLISTHSIPAEGFVSEAFVLSFTKTLLNQRK